MTEEANAAGGEEQVGMTWDAEEGEQGRNGISSFPCFGGVKDWLFIAFHVG